MTMYAPRIDITSIRVGAGGCGQEHSPKKNQDHFGVTCATCELELAKLGWTNRPIYTELTPDEEAERDLLEKRSKIEQGRLMEALALVAKERVEAERSKK